MTIFDKIAGLTKFKKGMVAGAKPFEAKFAQHAEALERLEKSFGKEWKKTKDVADKILNSLEATERERLYGLNTQIDIKDLNPEIKDFLIAILYTLSRDSSNEFQQSYIRSVQKYLDVKNPSSINDFSGIDNIDSTNARKAVFQSCVEYLLLEKGGMEFFDKYNEKLFYHFAFKEEHKEEIWEDVLNIYTATGPLGLAEKYGYVPEFKNKENVLSGDERLLEEYLVDDLLKILSGQELIIENKEIVLRDDIQCDGKLVFKNCILRYKGDNIRRQIFLSPEAILEITGCIFVGMNKDTKNTEQNKYFIQGKYDTKKDPYQYSTINVDKSLFINCMSLFSEAAILLSNSMVRYTNLSYLPAYQIDKYTFLEIMSGKHNNKTKEELEGTKPAIKFNFNDRGCIILNNCLIEAEDIFMTNAVEYSWIRNVLKLEKCTFKNVSNVVDIIHDTDGSHFMKMGKREIKNCNFLNCKEPVSLGIRKNIQINTCVFESCITPIKYFGHEENSLICDCFFINCETNLDMGKQSKLKNCNFVKCKGKLINVFYGDAIIENCEFIDVQQPKPPEEHYTNKLFSVNQWLQMYGMYYWGINLERKKDNNGITLRNCLFDGINHFGFITYRNEKKPFSSKIT